MKEVSTDLLFIPSPTDEENRDHDKGGKDRGRGWLLVRLAPVVLNQEVFLEEDQWFPGTQSIEE